MASEGLTQRLARAPLKVECPICRHRQFVTSAEERCDQCSSEIALYEDREAARQALDALTDAGRVAFLRELDGGVFAVIANRTFPRKAAP